MSNNLTQNGGEQEPSENPFLDKVYRIAEGRWNERQHSEVERLINSPLNQGSVTGYIVQFKDSDGQTWTQNMSQEDFDGLIEDGVKMSQGLTRLFNEVKEGPARMLDSQEAQEIWETIYQLQEQLKSLATWQSGVNVSLKERIRNEEDFDRTAAVLQDQVSQHEIEIEELQGNHADLMHFAPTLAGQGKGGRRWWRAVRGVFKVVG